MANILQRMRNTMGNVLSGVLPAKMPQLPIIPQGSDEVGPRGSVPMQIKGRMSGWGIAPNLSTVTVSISDIQSAIRQAERGDTYRLYTLYRDTTLGSAHIQSELNKRKMVVCGAPYSIQPFDKKAGGDGVACDAIKYMIEDCENWDMGIGHLMDACLWPAIANEKIFEDNDTGQFSNGVRYGLKKFFCVWPELISYKLPYLAQGGFNLPNQPGIARLPVQTPTGLLNPVEPMDSVWNPDSWEPDLRFYRTYPNGFIDFSWANMYAPDPMRHIIHRGTLFGGVRDNFGSSMRSIMFWAFLSIQARDWWSRSMERFGAPFIVGKTNAQSVDSVNFMQSAIQTATKVFGMAIDRKDEVELIAANSTNLSEGFKMFFDACNREISKIIVGQTTSSEQQKGGGIGDGTATLHADVKEDIRQFDQKLLGNTLRRQLFEPFMKINGIPGNAPRIVWGGVDEEDAKGYADMLVSLKQAGLRATPESMEMISEKLGINVEIDPEPQTISGGMASKGGKSPQKKAD
jgi:hypothetical protein